MNKINRIVLSTAFIIFLVCMLGCFEHAFARTYISSSTVKATGMVIDNGLRHTAINYVSSIDKLLNARVSINFGVAESVKVKLKYYINDSSSSIVEVKNDSVFHKTPFFLSTQKLDVSQNDKINYQIEAIFTYRDAKERTKITTNTVCWPEENNPNAYHTAIVTSSITKSVNGSEGGAIVLETGDQSGLADTFVMFPKGAFDGTKEFVIEELSVDKYIEPINKASSNENNSVVNPNKPIKLYSFRTLDGGAVTLNQGVAFNIYYPNLSSRDILTLKAGQSLSEITENINIKVIDVEKKLIVSEINKTAYYALFTDIDLTDNDYRPARRVIVKARAESRGDVFAFNYLKEGDSVKIYNINGKKVREIKSGTFDGFVWDGKNDSGQWVESGTYIYQIKVQGNSKLINGTIAFVK